MVFSMSDSSIGPLCLFASSRRHTSLIPHRMQSLKSLWVYRHFLHLVWNPDTNTLQILSSDNIKLGLRSVISELLSGWAMHLTSSRLGYSLYSNAIKKCLLHKGVMKMKWDNICKMLSACPERHHLNAQTIIINIISYPNGDWFECHYLIQ